MNGEGPELLDEEILTMAPRLFLTIEGKINDVIITAAPVLTLMWLQMSQSQSSVKYFGG